MLIGISGTISSGKEEITRYLTYQGFRFIAVKRLPPESFVSSQQEIDDNIDSEFSSLHTLQRNNDDGLQPDIEFPSVQDLLNYATNNWQQNLVVMPINDYDTIDALAVRPFFLHLIVDAPCRIRFERFNKKHHNNSQTDPLAYQREFPQFVELSEQFLNFFVHSSSGTTHVPTIKIINNTKTVKDLYIQLSKLNILDPSRLRPNWDTYFMKLASLAALRSNCMKRRVGCVITKDHRVIATGYNGTPRHLRNCNEGGCARCNNSAGSTASTATVVAEPSSSASEPASDSVLSPGSALSGSLASPSPASTGVALSTCLCLHAEENALLESGRERINNGGPSETCILYCNTCPCLTCSIKIIQSGVTEVVYSQSYSMDAASKQILNEAGIILRQFFPPKDVLIA